MKKQKHFSPIVQTPHQEIETAVDTKLEEAKKLIQEALKLAKENDIYVAPIQKIFTFDEIEEEFPNWDSSNC